MPRSPGGAARLACSIKPSALRRLGPEPAFRDHFPSPVESNGVGTLRITLTVHRTLPAAKREERHRRRHAGIDAEQPDLDALAEGTSRCAGLREAGDRVAVSAAVCQRDRRVQVWGAHHAHHRAKSSSRPTHISGATSSKTVGPRKPPGGLWGDGLGTAVEAKPGPFRHPALDRGPDPLFLLWVHHGTERRGLVQAVSQFEFTCRADDGICDGGLPDSIADRHRYAAGKTALSRRAEARSDPGGQGALQVGVGQDDQMALRSAVCLNALVISHNLTYRSTQESGSRVYALARAGLDAVPEIGRASVSQLGLTLKALTLMQKRADRV
ncbi:hypothetical protein FTUN_2309 [Frigoriglobus tundricola]|uniref:Uncharacterized protein n=1 Tax=Frigoriglobus tundricola TaxID=2774151 RepID=A0A6M5YN71_9BACT|nr:hypothetical protein FTUN_2309 [Frigoriglobus tundricola]